jgi:TolB protein
VRTDRRAAQRGVLATGALVLCAAAAATPAQAGTQLGSRTAAGGLPNAPSLHPAFAQDRKAASLLAFDSAATDIAAGDAPGASDVFVVHRAKPFKPGAKRAKEWLPGATDLVSTGMGGAAADGASYAPDLDGDQLHRAHCVAFLSDATNLVPGDTNGKTDAFVKDLDSGQVTRVSVGSAGEQADGASYDVQVDGACDRVAFTSDASNLAFTLAQLPPPRTVSSPLTGPQRRRCRKRFKGHRQAQRKRCKTRPVKVASERTPAVTTAPPPGTRQVYVRVLGGQPDDSGLVGLTFLASASATGEAGNGNSSQAAFGDLGTGCPKACGTTSGDAVAFTSEATNLTPGDGNGASDVYERTFRIPTQHFRERRAKLPAYMKPATRLVSATAGGGAGNGASDQPAVNSGGDVIGFRTAAADLVAGDSNGVTDVVYADLSRARPKLKPVSAGGNGASSSPALSRNGSPLLFATDADNLASTPAPDRDCVSDALLWAVSNGRRAIESVDAGGSVAGTCPAPAGAAGAANPAISLLGNYAAFDDSRALTSPAAGGGDPRQVYVHFVGP